MRSGLLTAAGLALVLGGVIFAARERGRGDLTKLKAQLGANATVPPPAVIQFGGQEALVLQRSPMAGGMVPEFVTATFLPGRGMNLLQLRAFLPQKGEVDLLASPRLEDAAKLMNGAALDENGAGSLGLGGALELPWGSRLGGVASADGKNVMTTWQGRGLSVPVTVSGAANGGMAMGGLLLTRGADTVETNVMPDGDSTKAVFEAGSFGGRWLAKTEVTMTALLSSHILEIKVVAKNTGTEAEPVGVGWSPRFAIVSGDRSHARLKLPSGERVEVGADGRPTGKLLAVTDTGYDYTSRGGVALGDKAMDASFVHLKQSLLDNGPVVELRDQSSGYGLRLTALTAAIKCISVHSPADGSVVTINPRFNYDDPFGREWAKEQDTGMMVLQPGESAQWKVRLEIFSLDNVPVTHF